MMIQQFHPVSVGHATLVWTRPSPGDEVAGLLSRTR